MSDKDLIAQNRSVNGEAEALIAKAIDANVPVETMEKLMAMRRELRAEQAKHEYDKAMAAFQAKCPTIVKTKQVKTNSGALAYKYAPIESIVDQVKVYLEKNGFSYSTSMDLIEGDKPKVKVAIKITHKAGHSEVTEMTVPLGTKTGIMSETQVVAAAATFAKRYAFCNAFGILTGDDDTDAPSTKRNQITTNTVSSGPITAKPTTAAQVVYGMSDKQKKYILSLLGQKNKTQAELDKVCKANFKKDFLDISGEEASIVIDKLNNLPDPKPKTEEVKYDEESVDPDDIPENLGESA